MTILNFKWIKDENLINERTQKINLVLEYVKNIIITFLIIITYWQIDQWTLITT